MPKLHEKEIIRLEIDEVVKLINQAENPDLLTKNQQSFNKHTKVRDVAILTLFLGTGIRISELVGLNIEDIDFSINGFKITRKGGNQVVLYFSDVVRKALIQYIEERNNNKKTPKDESALFLSLQNKRIGVRAVEKLVKKYSSVVTPLKKITPHKLRSTYGTNLYRETQDIYIVADVLGHKDVNTTKRHYAAISEDLRKNAALSYSISNKKKD
jgi:site-specific recombinase XerD